MSEKIIREAFQTMKVPKINLVENVRNQLHLKKINKRKKIRPWVMAACLSLIVILPLTTFAVEKIIHIIETKLHDDSAAEYMVDIKLGVTSLDVNILNNLSKHRLDSVENQGKSHDEIAKNFQNYYEVEEFIGVSLLESALLNNTIGSDKVPGVRLAAMGRDTGIQYIFMDSMHNIKGSPVPVHFNVTIMTEETDTKQGTTTLFSSDSQPADLIIQSYLSKSNGLHAEIAYVPKHRNVSAYFVHQSIAYNLEIKYTDNSIDPLELMKEVIDSFK